MRRTILFAVGMLVLAGCATTGGPSGIDRATAEGPKGFLEQAVVGPLGDGAYVVPTQQLIDPPGHHIPFPHRPVGLALHPEGKLLAVKHHRGILLIDLKTREIVQTLGMPKGQNSFYGIAWNRGGTTLWATGSEPILAGAALQESGRLKWESTIDLPGPGGKGNSVPGGFAFDEAERTAYVALSRNNTVAVVNLEAGTVSGEIPVGVAPYHVLRAGGKLYVTNWAGRRPQKDDLTGNTSGSQAVINEQGIASTGTVSVIDIAQGKAVAEIEVDLHPSGMCLSPDGTRLYIANANSDTISVINTEKDTVVARWGARPMAELPFGSAPNALTVSKDGTTLYVCNGGNNCLAVLDTATGKLRGLIPTGWYPAEVLIAPDNMLCVANLKGVGSRMLDYPGGLKIIPHKKARLEQYNAPHGLNTHDHQGSVSILPIPSESTLQKYSYEAAVNMRLPRMKAVRDGETGKNAPVPTRPGEVSPIKHVMYIIKENRTYDQVFGDMPQGNGDISLCHFPREVTPNHHALAEEFVLLDNFYCNGVLSADGHQWTDEGYVVDYIEKSFGDWPRSYPYDGDDVMAYASSGFIWDHVLAAGLSFRNYGEMVLPRLDPGNATWTDIYKDYLDGVERVKIRAKAAVHGLQQYTCPNYVGFPGKITDVYRAQRFLEEFAACVEKGEWYNFTIMLLPNDHTVGTREGYPTPRATVADNDLALGRIVEAISNSPFWPETAIFVVQDDPQAGVDHVDGHRTVAFCISPYTKRGQVESTFYNQNSMLRSIELILGLPPMNQLNMAATPMNACFTDTPDLSPYKALPNQIPLDEMNPKVASLRGKQRYYAQKSMDLPLDDVDMADEDTLNRIIWHSVKGYDTPYPKLAQRGSVEAQDWGLPEREED